MEFEFIILFGLIALMRIIQTMSAKRVSDVVSGARFFRYGGYYNLLSALLSLIVLLCSEGKYFQSLETFLCSLAAAVFLGLELFVYLKILKKTSLIVAQMFSVCSLCIPCLVGTIAFDEPMNLYSWLGIALFILSLYFMISNSEQKEKQGNKVKLSISTLILLLVYCLCGGGIMIVQKIFALKVEGGNVSEFSFLMFALNSLIFYVIYFSVKGLNKGQTERITIENKTDSELQLSKPLLICGLFQAVAIFMINLSVTSLAKNLPSALLFSISYAISIVTTMLVGAICCKEKITTKNVVGIILAAVAIIVINFLSA